MTAARVIEYRITRNLQQQERPGALEMPPEYAERLIAIAAVTGGLLVFGSMVPELVIAALAGSLVWALAGR